MPVAVVLVLAAGFGGAVWLGIAMARTDIAIMKMMQEPSLLRGITGAEPDPYRWHDTSELDR